jgi:hypothetical protein
VFVLLITDGVMASKVLTQGYDEGLFTDGTQVIVSSSLLPSLWAALEGSSSRDAIMKGLLATFPYPEKYFSLHHGQKFVEKFRNLTSTHSVDASSGEVVCSKREDDAQAQSMRSYLYALNQTSNATETVCLGFESFKSFHENGSNIDPSVLYTYDAVYAVAYAIDDLLSSSTEVGNLTAARLYEYMTSGSTTFKELTTGNVSFSGSSGGIRETGHAFKLLNYQAQAGFSGTGSSTTGGWYSEYGLTFVGEYSDATGWLLCGQADDEATMDATSRSQCTDPIYRTANGGVSPPADRPHDKVILGLSRAYSGVLIAFASLGLVPLFLVAALLVSNWERKEVRLIQPKLGLIMTLGGIFGQLKVLVAASKPTIGTCIAELWLGHIAFQLVFVTLLLRLWRIEKILHSRNRSFRVLMGEGKILVYLSADLLIICIILLAISALCRRSIIGEVTSITANQRTVEIFCAAPKDPLAAWLNSILYLIESVFLVLSLWYTYLTRDAPPSITSALTTGKPTLISLISR